MKIDPINVMKMLENSSMLRDNINMPSSGAASLDFAALIENNIKDIASNLKKSEKLSKLGAVGKVDLHDLAVQLSETELKLKTLINIRDGLVGLIQELNRTQL